MKLIKLQIRSNVCMIRSGTNKYSMEYDVVFDVREEYTLSNTNVHGLLKWKKELNAEIKRLDKELIDLTKEIDNARTRYSAAEKAFIQYRDETISQEFVTPLSVQLNELNNKYDVLLLVNEQKKTAITSIIETVDSIINGYLTN